MEPIKTEIQHRVNRKMHDAPVWRDVSIIVRVNISTMLSYGRVPFMITVLPKNVQLVDPIPSPSLVQAYVDAEVVYENN